MKLVWVVIPLVLIGMIGIQESFGSFVGSPNFQLESGVAPDDITCRDNLVLIFRTNGNPACVKEQTAEKLSWKIIKTIFKEQKNENDLSTLSTDLSNIVLSSNVLDGNYITGLWTESMKGVTRAPAPSLIDSVYNAIILQNGSALISPMTQEFSGLSIQDFIEQNTQTRTPDYYLRYFPNYIPDGLELKFFTFGSSVSQSGEYEGSTNARLFLLYLPISVEIEPTQITGAEVMDLGGIIITIHETPSFVKYQEQDHADKMVSVGHNLTISNNINIFWGGEETSFLIPPHILFQITSMGNSPEELLNMAESITTNI